MSYGIIYKGYLIESTNQLTYNYHSISKLIGKDSYKAVTDGSLEDLFWNKEDRAEIKRSDDEQKAMIDKLIEQGYLKDPNNYDLLFTHAGGCVVVSNRLEEDQETRDYKKIAHLFQDSTKNKLFDQDLPAAERLRLGF